MSKQVLGQIEGNDVTIMEVKSMIKENGVIGMHTVIDVGVIEPDESGTPVEKKLKTTMSHSVGMTEKGLPEVVVFGMEDQVAEHVFMWVQRVLMNEAVIGDMYFIESPNGRGMCLVDIDDTTPLKEAFSDVLQVYWDSLETGREPTNEKRIMQLVLSDENGQFPWSEHYSPAMRRFPYIGEHAKELGTKAYGKELVEGMIDGLKAKIEESAKGKETLH